MWLRILTSPDIGDWFFCLFWFSAVFCSLVSGFLLPLRPVSSGKGMR